LTSKLGEKEPNAEDHWRTFESANSRQFERTQAFAFVADFLRSLEKERNFLNILIKLFGEHEAGVLQIQNELSEIDTSVEIRSERLSLTSAIRANYVQNISRGLGRER
jgi:hypothetical protein